MPRFEFFYDYGSPYSYLANSRIPGLVARTGAEVVYRPMLLGGVFKATNNQSPFFEPVLPKRAYFSLELKRCVRALGVPFEQNPAFPINTLLLMRATHAAIELGVFDRFHASIYPAFWAAGANLGDPDVIADVLNADGLDGKEIVAAASSDQSKQALRATTDEAVERGLFGAPTFFVGCEMYFGNDRMDAVEEALVAAEEE